MRPLALLLSSALTALALTQSGCGSDSSGGQGGATSLEGKKLSELTPAERSQFCATNGDAFAALVAGSCSLSGLDAPTKTECDTAVAACRADSSATGTVCQETPDAGGHDFSDCSSLRVMQVESCLTEAKTYFAMLTCESAGQEPPMLPSCLGTLQAECPALLTGAGD
ncbi:MAG TPA: hypothetical protein VHU80_13025 [Polyangiaceae bacterium]|jgi:hypothetical protein|nr:hypothetical protein [Polyangiaceae bacterium]